MKDIFEIAVAILASIGGAGVIIVGLSSWLGKVWANRILEQEKTELSKDVEGYKNKLDTELQRLNFANDKAIHVSKNQYEKEFQFYTEIWESLVELTNKTLNLFPLIENVPADKEKLKQYKLDKYDEFVKAYNQYLMLTKKYLPFYNKEISEKFDEFRNLCSGQGITYETYVAEPLVQRDEDWLFDLSKDEALITKREVPKKIQALEKAIAEAIRDYLYSLQEIN